MKFILGVHRSPSGHKGCYSGIRSGLASTETRDCGFGPRPGTELAIASCTPALILLNSSCCKAAGRLAKLYVDQGDRVQQGQVIAQMDDRDIQAQLRQQQANLALAEAALAEAVAGSRSEEIAQAENQVKAAQAQAALTQARSGRYQQLFQQGAISQDQLQEVLTNERNNQATLQQVQQKLLELKHGNRIEFVV